MKLSIGTVSGKAFSLPIEFVTKTNAILAQRRKGKTYTASVMAEELVRAKQPFVALDPTGAWWGLLSSADGKSAGLPVVVLGGQHGHIPLERTGGAVVADLVVDQPGFYVIDFSLFESGAAERQFATDFAERLYRRKAQAGKDFPLHLFVDEADRFVPQRPADGDQRMLGAFEAIVRRGGLRGLGTTLISQRSAVVNKNVLEMIDCLITLRTVGPNDQAAIENYIKAHGSQREREAMMKSLAALDLGEAWVWEPGAEPALFERVRIRARHTFNSSATPKPGERKVEPRALAEVDIAAVRDRMAATIEQAKANDPAELKRTIAQLRKDLAAKPAAATPEAKGKTAQTIRTLRAALVRHHRALEAALKIIVKVKAIDFAIGSVDSQAALEQAIAAAVSQVTAPIEKRVAALVGRVDGIKEQAAAAETAINSLLTQTVDVTLEVQKSAPYMVRTLAQGQQSVAPLPRQRHHPTSPTAGSGTGERLPPGELAVLKACAQYHDGCRREQLSILTGYKRSSRDAYIARLAQRGFVSIQGELVLSTSDGRTALGSDFEPLPTGEDLQRYWLERLPPGEKAVLDVAIKAYPGVVTRETIDLVTGYKRSSRDAYIARLAARQVITAGRGEIRASEVLFA